MTPAREHQGSEKERKVRRMRDREKGNTIFSVGFVSTRIEETINPKKQ